MSKKHKRCVVMGCQNRSDQGKFVGDLCYPCHSFVAEGTDGACTSQAYRNALNFVWPRIKQSVAAQIGHLLFGFEGRPHELSPLHRGGSLTDSELASMVFPENDLEQSVRDQQRRSRLQHLIAIKKAKRRRARGMPRVG